MEFGKIPNVENVDWTLPSDAEVSTVYMKSLGSNARTEYLVGAPAWSHKSWVGVLYPPGTKPSDYLYHYARHFDCIELNTTHYRIPFTHQVMRWVEQVPNTFLFCPKMLQAISHSPQGMLDKELLTQWWQFLESLKANLGPCFMQLPPHFDYSQKSLLHQFLRNWPVEFDLSLEFRHPSWFQNGHILPALTQYLQTRNIGLVITDVAGRRDVVHTSISAPYTMLRFIGSAHHSDDTRAHEWAKKFHHWSDLGLKKIFFFVHEPEDMLIPEMTAKIRKELKTGPFMGARF